MLTIPMSPAAIGYLDQMVSAGLFGRTREDVAARLIDEGIRRKLDFSGIKVAIFAIAPAQNSSQPARALDGNEAAAQSIAPRASHGSSLHAADQPQAAPRDLGPCASSAGSVKAGTPSTEAPGLVAPADVRALDHAPGEPDSTTGASSSAAAGASPTSSAPSAEEGEAPPPAAARKHHVSPWKRCKHAGCTGRVRLDNKTGKCRKHANAIHQAAYAERKKAARLAAPASKPADPAPGDRALALLLDAGYARARATAALEEVAKGHIDFEGEPIELTKLLVAGAVKILKAAAPPPSAPKPLKEPTNRAAAIIAARKATPAAPPVRLVDNVSTRPASAGLTTDGAWVVRDAGGNRIPRFEGEEAREHAHAFVERFNAGGGVQATASEEARGEKFRGAKGGAA